MFDTRNLSRQEILSLLPEKLYKYYSINKNTLKVIEEGKLWFSTPMAFNDPFDCKVTINFGSTREEIINSLDKFLPSKFNHFVKDPDMVNFFDNPIEANKLLNTIFSYAFDDCLGVCCFSEMPNIPLMWSHYAGSHSGICLEFDNKQSGFIRDNLIPVNYYSEYPKFNIKNDELNDFHMFLMQLIASKSYDWDYEFEWRAITEQGGSALYKFDKANLSGVIFGINTEDCHVKEISSLIRESGYENVSFKKASLSENKYLIDINEI